MSDEEEKKNNEEIQLEIEGKAVKDKSNQNTPKKEEKLEYTKMIGNYLLFDQIGMGTFSKVTRAVHVLTEQVVAVKILEKEKIEDDIDVERIIREIEILKNINHPNIAQMYETYTTVHNIYLMIEYAEGGDLSHYINQTNYLSEQKACYFFRQIIGVIEYLNMIGISHRDIKTENILLDKDKKNIKVIDFGLSNYCSGKRLLHSSCGSPCYASPEMLSGKPYQGITTDIWSSGIVLYSMLVGFLPFDESDLGKLYDQIKKGQFYLPSTLSLEAMDFLKNILMVDPKKRMGLNEIKNHAWFKMEKNPMYKGINFREEIFPCDMKVSSYVMKHYFEDDPDVNIDSLVEMVKNNACNKYTATYYLTKKYILCIEDKYKTIDDDDNENLLSIPNEKKNEIKDMKNKNNSDKNNSKEKIKIRSKTEENQMTKIVNKNEEKNEKIEKPSITINNNNERNNILKEENNIILNEFDNQKNINKNRVKQNVRKSRNNTKEKESFKIELPNLYLINNEAKMNKSKQKIQQRQKISNIIIKSNIIKKKNNATINNLKSFAQGIYDYGKRELSQNKNSLIDNMKIISKKKSPQNSNNFNFYVTNNMIPRDKQKLGDDLINVKLINHRKNKSSSVFNTKFKKMPLSNTQDKINTESENYGHINDKLLSINDDIKTENRNKSKNLNNNNSNIIMKKKVSAPNTIINNNINKKRNLHLINKNLVYHNRNPNNNYNYNKSNINTNININNIDKFVIKNIINYISDSNYEKERLKTENLTLCQNLTNQSENIFLNKIEKIKNKQGNNDARNYMRNKNLLNYTKNNTLNNIKLHQRNLSYALRHQLTNFKTDISNKSNIHSISKEKEKLQNESLLTNPYFPTERDIYKKKVIKEIKIGNFANNKSQYKNKVI